MELIHLPIPTTPRILGNLSIKHMFNSHSLRLVFSFLLFLFCGTSSVFANDLCNKITLTQKTLKAEHISPIKNIDTLKVRLVSNFIENTDPLGIIYLRMDIESFDMYSNTPKSLCELASHLKSVYHDRLMHTISMIESISFEEADFSKSSIVTLHQNERSYPVDTNDIQRLVIEELRYRGEASAFFSIHPDSLKSTSIDSLIKMSFRNSIDAKEAFICHYKDNIQDEKSFDEHFTYQFMNSLTNSYDPHTAFFNESVLNMFMQSLSSEAPTFGIAFDKNKFGEIIVANLQPGGPAWASNLMHEGDRIVDLTWNDLVPIDYKCYPPYRLSAFLDNQPQEQLIVHFKGLDGEIKKVKLNKAVCAIDENAIKSFILNIPGGPKLAYLSIPSFYSDWEGFIADGMANDVAKELVKLNRQHIDGLILDLRGNGGGSIKEALDLTGIFINDGPVALSEVVSGNVLALKDLNRGSIYNGPLLVMVDAGSASASEIVAGALQDYNRAVIVGSRTYGKATGQSIKPLNNNADGNSAIERSNDVLKVTEMKLYRVNGASNQYSGLMPDVILPTLITDSRHEYENPFALLNDTTAKMVKFKKLPSLPLDKLLLQSEKRVAENTYFQGVEILNEKLKLWYAKEIELDLDVSSFKNLITSNLMEFYREELLPESSGEMTAANNSFDAPLIEFDDQVSEINDMIMNGLTKDPYVIESYHILSDLITQ